MPPPPAPPARHPPLTASPARRPPCTAGSLATIRKSTNGLSHGYRLLSCLEATANQAAILKLLLSNDVCQLDGGDIRAVTVAGNTGHGPSTSQVSVSRVLGLGSRGQGLRGGHPYSHGGVQHGTRTLQLTGQCVPGARARVQGPRPRGGTSVQSWWRATRDTDPPAHRSVCPRC